MSAVDGTHDAAPGGPGDDVPLGTALVMAALGAAAIAQGAYHRDGQILTGILLVVAVVSAFRDRRVPVDDLRSPPFVIAALLAAWTVVSAVASGDITAAGPPLLLLSGCVVAAALCRGAGDAATVGLLVLGALVALSGLVGVAWRIEPWALEGLGVWQAATTLSYANAAAGLLVPVLLLAASRLASLPRSAVTAAVTCLLLVAVGATLSRGGALALVVGLCVLARSVGVRPLASGVMWPAVGAAVALAALVPSMVATRPPMPWLAVAGLGAGVLAAAGSARPGWPPAATGALVAVLVAMACVLGISGVASDALSAGRRTRLTLGSADRVDEAGAALRVGAAHPVVGAGPGRASLTWESDGTRFAARYAHNEYLQTFAELGAVGLVIVLALVASIGSAARRRLAVRSDFVRAGAAAGLAALAVHSGLDFLWHVPAIPLLGAVLVGLSCLPVTRRPSPAHL